MVFSAYNSTADECLLNNSLVLTPRRGESKKRLQRLEEDVIRGS